MSRRSRHEKRLLQEQDTVEMRRAERKEQEALAGIKKVEAALTKAQRLVKPRQKESDRDARPPRVARVGKPLKR
jgi:hypothetical protein